MDTNEGLEFDTATDVIGGFGRLLVAIAALFTVATVRKLSNVFNYPPALIEEFENDRNPGYVFAMSLRERGIIVPNDVSVLIDALGDISLHGIANEVTGAFEKHCKQKETFESTNKVRERGHRPSTNEVMDLFRRQVSVSQSTGGVSPNQRSQKASFINSIKITYRGLYEKVQPIPFIRDKLLCVDNVFIDSGVERLIKKGVNEAWKKLISYHCLFNDLPPAPTRCVLFGEPGFGKSTLALQLVYDWCTNCSKSPLKEIDVLLFLRLRQLTGVSSIFKAIKQFILPRDSPLRESDITEIIYSSKSVVVLLDGFDEYANKSGEDDDDVTEIIKGHMFQNFFVVVTTRPSFKLIEMPADTVQLRLTGFDAEAQDNYLRKTLSGSDRKAVAKIKSYIQENHILRDLCEVPLFFAMFSHMFVEKEMSIKFDSATGFFRYMIGSFHEHMKNKLNSNELKKYEQLEKNHRKLDKASFEALAGGKQEIVWMKNQLQKLIGRDLYDQHIAVGILVEEETVVFNDKPGSPTSAMVIRNTQTRFYHKLFCEWFAAHHISDLATKALKFILNRTLKKIDPFELQYVLRFACGINPTASSRIIKYLRRLEGGDKFAILCILEQTGQVDNILDSIRQLCFEGVIISGYDSRLLQRSSFQLLEIASKHNIPIEFVELCNCLQSVDLSTSVIRTTSSLALTSRIPIKVLMVSLYNRDMTKDEAIDILQFATMCPSLRGIWYYGCVPPRVFTNRSTLSFLKSRDVTVWWRWGNAGEPDHILNLQTGRWVNEKDGSEPTEEDLERKLSKDAEQRKGWTEEAYKGWVKEGRERLRKDAEKELAELRGEGLEDEDDSDDDDVSEENSDIT